MRKMTREVTARKIYNLMGEYKVKIKQTGKVTHDVLRFVTEKPENYTFKPGQGNEVAIDKDGWRDEKRPFTFTSIPSDDVLEFNIKTYPEKDGVTKKMLELMPGDHFLLHEPFGTIFYKGDGVFIAGGAGITPFIAIFRMLETENKLEGNKLIFGNKKKKDIIHREELKEKFGDSFINVLSEEETGEYEHGFIDKDIIKKYVEDFQQYFYLCGPPEMVEKLEETLEELGVEDDFIVKEGKE